MVRTTVEVPATLGCHCHMGTEQVIWRWLAVDLGCAVRDLGTGRGLAWFEGDSASSFSNPYLGPTLERRASSQYRNTQAAFSQPSSTTCTMGSMGHTPFLITSCWGQRVCRHRRLYTWRPGAEHRRCSQTRKSSLNIHPILHRDNSAHLFQLAAA